MSNIKPLYDRVVIKRMEEEKLSAGGIVIPDSVVFAESREATEGDLVLSKGAIKVSTTWRNPYSGETGTAGPTKKNDELGYFYFFEATNPEVFVKVLDWGADRPYLLFWAGLTDFEYEVTFRNVATGATVVTPGPFP